MWCSQIWFFTKRLRFFELEFSFSIQRFSFSPSTFSFALLVTNSGGNEFIIVIPVFFTLREGIRDRQVSFMPAKLFQYCQPLLLVHGISSKKEGQHVFHSFIVSGFPQPGGQYSSGRFCHYVGVHIGSYVP